jgi:flagellar biosynthesis GTPase FlhF
MGNKTNTVSKSKFNHVITSLSEHLIHLDEDKPMLTDELPVLKTHMRDGGSISMSEGKYSVEFGKISFVENGKEYDLNKIMKRKLTEPCYSFISQIIPGGVIISGVTLMYPDDFLESDEVDWQDTLAYREKQKHELEIEQKRREDEQKRREDEQKHREEEQKQKADAQREAIAKMSPEEYNKFVEEKMKAHHEKIAAIHKAAEKQKQRILNSMISESKETVAKKYPNLGGRYFGHLWGRNLDFMISNDMSDVQRIEFFQYWDAGHKEIRISDQPNYVQINRFCFEEDDSGDIVIRRLSDNEYYQNN